MGRLHDYKTLIRAAELGLPPELRIRIHAFGSSYNQLKVELGNFGSSGLILGNPLTPRLWREALKSSEISLITMVSGAETVVMPSKTYSALAAGHAILAICEKKSDLASLIERHDCGWVICPGDYAALRTLLFELSTIPASIRSKRQNAMKAAGLEYNLKLCAERWVEVFDAAEAERGVI
jgi:glycosyltransferase involved in cell wall biosynthesis